MRDPALSVSSSCCPRLPAGALAAAVLAAGGDAVELRVGRGQAWEAGGAIAVAAEGVGVTAVAGSRAFGLPAPAGDEDLRQAELSGARLRCFLAAGCEADEALLRRARGQLGAVQALLGGAGRVVIEPHPGRASVAAVARLCADTGAGAVLDLLALRRLGCSPASALRRLGGAAQVLHVKGFETGTWRHRPLRAADLPAAAALAAAPRLAAVVVETRAGSHWHDLRLLRRRWPEVAA